MTKYCIFIVKPDDKDNKHKIVFTTTIKFICGMKLKKLKQREKEDGGIYYVAKIR